MVWFWQIFHFRHSSQTLLDKYVSHCGVCPAFQPDKADEVPHPEEEADQELGKFEGEVEEAPEQENSNDAGPALEGSDAQCFEVLNQLQSREKADRVTWEQIGEDTTVLSDTDGEDSEDEADSKVGESQDPVTLAGALWLTDLQLMMVSNCLPLNPFRSTPQIYRAEKNVYNKLMKCDKVWVDAGLNLGSEMLIPWVLGFLRKLNHLNHSRAISRFCAHCHIWHALAGAFRKARVGHGDLVSIRTLIPHLWQLLRNLRESADQYAVANRGAARSKVELVSGLPAGDRHHSSHCWASFKTDIACLCLAVRGSSNAEVGGRRWEWGGRPSSRHSWAHVFIDNGWKRVWGENLWVKIFRIIIIKFINVNSPQKCNQAKILGVYGLDWIALTLWWLFG